MYLIEKKLNKICEIHDQVLLFINQAENSNMNMRLIINNYIYKSLTYCMMIRRVV